MGIRYATRGTTTEFQSRSTYRQGEIPLSRPSLMNTGLDLASQMSFSYRNEFC